MKPLTSPISKAVLAALVAGSISACGDGGSSTAGISGTGITSGPITAFGSIYVNGIRFDIDDAEITVDDAGGRTQADLRKGMQVVVRGDVSGTSGTAVTVEFDELVEGPVSGLTDNGDGTKTFTVLGIQVLMDSTSTIFENVTFDTLADNNVIEVSGLVDGSGQIIASYIEKESNSFTYGVTEVEIKGTVANVTGTGTVGDSFTVKGVNIDIRNDVEFEDLPDNRVNNDDYVEVEGILKNATTIDALEIELEDENYGEDGDEVSLTGVVSGFTDINSTFKVGTQTVDASTAVLEPTSLLITDGLEVEVEGEISGTTLIADELEARDGDIEISAPIFQVNDSSIVLSLAGSTLEVFIDGSTQMKDETDPPVENLTIGNLGTNDFVELKALNNGTNIVATELKRDETDDVKLQGPVDSSVADTSITILGITFNEDPTSVTYKDAAENIISSTDFYNAISSGTVVEIQDDDPADGDMDEAELE